MINLYGKLHEDENKELLIDGISVAEILRKYCGKEISVSITESESESESES